MDEGQRVGSLCLFDTEPRGFDDAQRGLLEEMGLWVERELRDGAELDRAAEVQQGLLPVTRPLWPDYDFAGISVPVRNAGGDFYSWREVEGGVELTLADVMALISGLKTARAAGGDLRIARAQTQVLAVLQLTKLDQILHPHNTVEECFQ